MSISILLPPGFRPVLKHGDHDQSSHGNWASGNFQDYGSGGGGDLDAASDAYYERYGIKTDGSKELVGISDDEAIALDTYTAEGYKTINSFLREGKDKMDIDSLDPSELVEWDMTYQRIQRLDELIAGSPDVYGEKNLFRVYSERVLSGLNEGDVVTDKGFLSTTRVDITTPEGLETLQNLQMIRETSDIPAVILPSPSGQGKALGVDFLKNAIGDSPLITNIQTANTEKEVLLPRGTSLKFKGYKTVNEDGSGMKVAIFERMDK